MGVYNRSKTTTGWNKGIKYATSKYPGSRAEGRKELKFIRAAGLDVKIIGGRIYWKKKGWGRRFSNYILLDWLKDVKKNFKKDWAHKKYRYGMQKPKLGTKTKR